MNSNAISGMLGTIHGELRWVFVLVAVLGIGRTVYGLGSAGKFSALDHRLAVAYSILLDLQALYGLGIILYLAIDRLSLKGTANWIGWHPVWMLVAVIAGHLGSRWKDAPDRKRFQGQLVIYAVSLTAVFFGVLASPLNAWM